MPAELTDQEFLGSPSGEQTDEQFFGKELTDAEFLGGPATKSLTPETDKALVDSHSLEWQAAQRAMTKSATEAGLPFTTDPRQRLMDAISRSKEAGFPVQHFIGLPNEPTGDRGVTMDIENLVTSLRQREAVDPSISKERAYWEKEAANGMSADQWKQQTGESDPAYPTVFFTPRGHPAPVSTEPRVGPDPNDPQAIGPWSTTLTSVGLQRPFPDKGANLAEQTLNAVMNFPVDAANFGLSPTGAVTIGAVPILHPAIQRLVAAGFTADQIKNAVQAPNWQERLGSLLGAATTAVGIAKPAGEIIKGKPAEPTESKTATSAPLDQQTQPQAAEQPLNQPLEGATNATRTEDQVTETGGVPVEQQQPAVVQPEGQVNQGITQPESQSSQEPIGVADAIAEIQRRNAPADEPHISAIANRFVQERAAKGEIGEIAPGVGLSTAELVQRGLQMPPERVAEAVSRVVQGGEVPVNDAAAIRGEEARLQQRSNQLSRISESDLTNSEARLAADNAFKDLTDFHNGPVAQLKQNWANQGRSMQGEIPIDLGTFNGLREAWLKDTGEAPPASVEPTLRRTARNVERSVMEENGAMSRLGQEIEKATRGRKLPTADEVRANIRERMGLQPCK